MSTMGRDGARYDVVDHRPAQRARAAPSTGLLLPMFGEHNVQNSLAAIAVADEMGSTTTTCARRSPASRACKRRFTKTGECERRHRDRRLRPPPGRDRRRAARGARAPPRAASSPWCSRTATPASPISSPSSAPASTTPTRCSSPTSIPPARRRSRASAATRWSRACARAATATPMPLAAPAELAPLIARSGAARRFRRLPRRRLDHQLGAGAAGRARAAATPARRGSARMMAARNAPPTASSSACRRCAGGSTENAPLGAGDLVPRRRPGRSAVPPGRSPTISPRFLAAKPADVPVTVIGVASNLLVRDGGMPGVVVRLGRGFVEIAIDGTTIAAGAGALDLNVALTAARGGHRRARIPVRHSRHGRRRPAHECRRLWQRVQGRAGRRARRSTPAGGATR